MLAVTVEFELKPEHVASFHDAVRTQAAASLAAEPACRRFDVCLDPGNDRSVFLYEIYDDRAAFDLHLKTQHYAHFSQLVSPWIASKQVRLLNVLPASSTVSFSTETP